VTRWALLVALAVVALGAWILLAPEDEPQRTQAETTPQVRDVVRETTNSGLIAQLPHVGTLTWRCDRRLRFVTRLTLPGLPATVFVTLTSDGRRVWTRKQLDAGSLRAPPASVSQAWTVSFHHKDATQTSTASLRFGRSKQTIECAVLRATIRTRTL
jgi:hypothetical protein